MAIKDYEGACFHYLATETAERRDTILRDLACERLLLSIDDQRALYEFFQLEPPSIEELVARRAVPLPASVEVFRMKPPDPRRKLIDDFLHGRRTPKVPGRRRPFASVLFSRSAEMFVGRCSQVFARLRAATITQKA